MDRTRNCGGTGEAGHRRKDLTTACELSAQKGGLQPQRFRYWLNEVPDAQRDEKIPNGWETYARSPERAKYGESTLAMDELPGLQPLQPTHPHLPIHPRPAPHPHLPIST